MANDTRQKILETARQMFNEHGLFAVGVRDVARALGISPGNLAYHFPQKDKLVEALVRELHEANDRVVDDRTNEPFTFRSLYGAVIRTMRNQLHYRFVLISYLDVMRKSPELRQLEIDLASNRRRRTDTALRLLTAHGALVEERVLPQLGILHEQFVILVTSWLRSAEVAPVRLSDEEAIRHYAKLAIALLQPYCTPEGDQQFRALLSGDWDVEGDGDSRPSQTPLLR